MQIQQSVRLLHLVTTEANHKKVSEIHHKGEALALMIWFLVANIAPSSKARSP